MDVPQDFQKFRSSRRKMADQYSVLICLLLTSDTRVVLKGKFCFVKESFALKKKLFLKEIFVS